MLISISELIAQSWDNYLKTWRKFAPFLAVLISILVVRYFLGFAGLYLNAYTKLSSLTVDLTLAVIFLALYLLGLWTTLSMIKISQDLHKNLPVPNFKDSYNSSSRYILPTILISLLVGLILILGSVLFLIPGLIFFVWYYYATYAIIFEDQTNLDCLKTSKNLTLGRWFSMAFRIVIPKIVFFLLFIALMLILPAIINKVFNPSVVKYDLIVEIINGLLTALTLPLFIWSDVLLYFSAKTNPLVVPAPLKK